MGDERRQHVRVSFPKILVRVPSARRFRSEFVDDLSEGGLFVSTTKTLAVGRQVEIQLLPPGREAPLSLQGRVLRVEDTAASGERTGMAVEFEELDESAREDLARLLAEYTEGGAGAEEDEIPEEEDVRVDDVAEEVGAGRLEELETRLQERDEEVAELRTEAEKLREELEQVRGAGGGERTEAEDGATDTVLDLEKARREVDRLREVLSETESRAEKLANELRQHEEDEAVTRNLAERLATEKKKLDEQFHAEREEAREEIQRLERELEDTRTTLSEEVESLGKRVEEVEGALEEERSTTSRLQESLEQERAGRSEERERAERAEERLSEVEKVAARVPDLEDELRQRRLDAEDAEARVERFKVKAEAAEAETERAKGKNRELRRLLALVSDSGEAAAEAGGGDAAESILRQAEGMVQPPESEPGAAASSQGTADESPTAEGVIAPEEVPREGASGGGLEVEVSDEEVSREVPVPEGMGDAPIGEAPSVESFGSTAEEEASVPEEPAAPEEPAGVPEGLEMDESDPFATTASAIAGAGEAPVGRTAERDAPEETPEVSEPSDPFGVPPASHVEGPVPAEGEEAPVQDTQSLFWRAQAILDGIRSSEEEETGGADEPPGKSEAPSAGGAQSATAPRIESLEQFSEALKEGGTLTRTKRFSRHEPVTRQDIQVSDWLRDAENLEELKRLSNGKMPEEDLIQAVWVFYQRSLVEIV